MELLRAYGYFEIKALSGEVAYLWNRVGQLTLYSTRLELFQAQRMSEYYKLNRYIRNSRSKRYVEEAIIKLEKLIAEEKEAQLSFGNEVVL